MIQIEENFFDAIYLGLELKTWIAIIALSLTIINIAITMFKVSERFNNNIKLKKLDESMYISIVRLLIAIAYNKKEISINKFYYSSKDYENMVRDNYFNEGIYKLLNEYENIYNDSFFKSKKLRKKIELLRSLKNLIDYSSTNDIISTFLYKGSYQQLSPNTIKSIKENASELVRMIKGREKENTELLKDLEKYY